MSPGTIIDSSAIVNSIRLNWTPLEPVTLVPPSILMVKFPLASLKVNDSASVPSAPISTLPVLPSISASKRLEAGGDISTSGGGTSMSSGGTSISSGGGGGRGGGGGGGT